MGHRLGVGPLVHDVGHGRAGHDRAPLGFEVGDPAHRPAVLLRLAGEVVGGEAVLGFLRFRRGERSDARPLGEQLGLGGRDFAIEDAEVGDGALEGLDDISLGVELTADQQRSVATDLALHLVNRASGRSSG